MLATNAGQSRANTANKGTYVALRFKNRRQETSKNTGFLRSGVRKVTNDCRKRGKAKQPKHLRHRHEAANLAKIDARHRQCPRTEKRNPYRTPSCTSYPL